MAASAADLLCEVGSPGTATTLSAPGYTAGGTSITVGSTTNWPSSTGVIFAIDQAEVVNGVEVQVAGTYNEYVGVVADGTTVNNVAWVNGSGDTDYAAGALTRVYVAVTAERENRIVEWGTVEHNQDGTHGAVTATSVTASGTITAANFVQSGGADSAGWTVGLPAVSSVTANGNRSYTVEMASDVSDTLSEGMRLRTTRTVAAPNTSFSLDGSNDYYVKTSPSGMTFTDDFSVSAWVYLAAYSTQTYPVSRYNGTSGWFLAVNSDGTITLEGKNAGSANLSRVASYQSIPLNKWVHIAAQLDMSAFTATTTTSYIMIDGVNVPAQVARGGTNPTALVQAGNLEIGTINGGTGPFPGYIDQVAIYSAKVTQATHLAAMNQGLTGSETSLISAYSNGSTTDLAATGNNLTATNGATTVASSPFGNRGLSTTLDYGLVMKVATTTVTVQVPEGCTIPTSGGVSAVDYSTQANPYGWVSDKERFNIQIYYLTSLAGSTSTTASNVTGSDQTYPAGTWKVLYSGRLEAVSGTVGNDYRISVSKTSAISDWRQGIIKIAVATSMTNMGQFTLDTEISSTSTTTLYLVQVASGGVLTSSGVADIVMTAIPSNL